MGYWLSGKYEASIESVLDLGTMKEESFTVILSFNAKDLSHWKNKKSSPEMHYTFINIKFF